MQNLLSRTEVSSKLKHYGFKVSIRGINRTYQDDNSGNQAP